MNRKYIFLIVAVLLVVTAFIVLTYNASKEEKYTAESENWKVSLTLAKENEKFVSLICEYMGEINETINHFEYKLKGASDYFAGTERGNWDSKYIYKHSALSNRALVPNESNQFEITITFGGHTETLSLTK
ncbi:hypothetical protein [Cohnella cholangitidis]|uniref:Uncharacterized protein n=1 Tax=Cohnella cholangitidis TaxID=2598458 RepID=A0A7G5C4Y0_9BACL|nr:hypothetical protein [Cohnella cholangitidis]QMV44264.1 hypothetical protein FPL14_26175 [Cohnella cholangitidis]